MNNCVLVILNFNDSKRSLSLAKKCKTFSAIDKVIIVDNKSTDNSIEYLKQNLVSDDIDLIVSEVNKGFASGNNLGAKYAYMRYTPKFILFANTDTIFTDEDVKACIDKLKSDENLGLISMRIKNTKGIEERSAWKYKTYKEYCLSNIWLYRHKNYKNGVYLNYTQNFQYVEIVRGSFMLFKMKCLKDVNYFDENTFLYYEEEIICYKLRKAGYKVGILAANYYIHNHISKELNLYDIGKCMSQSLRYFLINYYLIDKLKIRIFDLTVSVNNIENKLISLIRRI